MRRGMTLPLVLIATVIAGIAVFTFMQAVRQESRGTHKLLRAIRAEAIAESAVARIASTLNQRPWEERFYLRYALDQASGGAPPAAEYPFNHRAFPFAETDEDFASGDASFTGAVKDVSVEQRRYRVRLLVTYRGYTLLGVYELRYSEGLLGALNRDTVLTRNLRFDVALPPDQLDKRIDAIQTEALKPQNLVDPGEIPQATQVAGANPLNADQWVPPAVSGPLPDAFSAPPVGNPGVTVPRGAVAPAVERTVNLIERTSQEAYEQTVRTPPATAPSTPPASSAPPPSSPPPAPESAPPPPPSGEPPPSGSEPTPAESGAPPSGAEPPPSSSEPPVTSSEAPPSGSEPPPSGAEVPPSGAEPPPSESGAPPSGAEPEPANPPPGSAPAEPPVVSSEAPPGPLSSEAPPEPPASEPPSEAPGEPPSNSNPVPPVSGGGGCFAPDTLVWTPRGMVAIATLSVGDTVWAMDVTTRLVVSRRVTATFTTVRDRLVTVRTPADVIVCSDNHRFHSRHGWKEVRELSEATTAGGAIALEVSPRLAAGQVHNLTVEGHNNYFVGYDRVLVHNRKSTEL